MSGRSSGRNDRDDTVFHPSNGAMTHENRPPPEKAAWLNAAHYPSRHPVVTGASEDRVFATMLAASEWWDRSAIATLYRQLGVQTVQKAIQIHTELLPQSKRKDTARRSLHCVLRQRAIRPPRARVNRPRKHRPFCRAMEAARTWTKQTVKCHVWPTPRIAPTTGSVSEPGLTPDPATRTPRICSTPFFGAVNISHQFDQASRLLLLALSRTDRLFPPTGQR